jgi:hypothetical protein
MFLFSLFSFVAFEEGGNKNRFISLTPHSMGKHATKLDEKYPVEKYRKVPLDSK